MPDPSSREEVLAELARILASSGFAEAGRLGPFLRHLVERALDGEIARLKESVLGVEVFQRPPDYDPRIDPIVRVEARRLRSRLEDYYAGPGAKSTVRIGLPKGTYVPVIAGQTGPDAQVRHRPWKLAAALLAVAAAALTAWLTLRPRPVHLAQDPSLAVFPFVNLSQGADNEYFSDGLAEELIAGLARVEGVRVAARSLTFQYKGKPVDVREIGRQLNVTNVLEGSVRRSGDRLRISAQLINVADGYQLWSHTYERREQDIFGVQEEIAAAIVNALRVELRVPQGRLFAQRYTGNLEVYNLYLKARFQLNRFSLGGLRKAEEYLLQALQLDPRYAPAHATLATIHSLLGYYNEEKPATAFQQAKEHARKAISLDASLSEAHSALGFALGFLDWNWKESEAAFLRAIELNPASTDAHTLYASAYLMPTGRLEEANREFRRALELDPLDMFAHYAYAFTLLAGGDAPGAVAQYQKTMELKPELPDAVWDLGMALGYAGRYTEADRYFRKHAEMMGIAGRYEYGPIEYILTGRPEDARRAARRLAAELSLMQEDMMDRARHLAMAGEKEAALRSLEEAVRRRETQVLWIKVDPRLAALRGDARYEALVKKVGL